MAEELVRYEYDAARFAHDSGIFVGRPVEMRRFDDRWASYLKIWNAQLCGWNLIASPCANWRRLRHCRAARTNPPTPRQRPSRFPTPRVASTHRVRACLGRTEMCGA
jgi:hypothetical protein